MNLTSQTYSSCFNILLPQQAQYLTLLVGWLVGQNTDTKKANDGLFHWILNLNMLNLDESDPPPLFPKEFLLS